MLDLTTTYLGLKLKNPLVVSPSPLSEQIGNILRMEDAGASAVVLHSLFEEQITIESQSSGQGSLGRDGELRRVAVLLPGHDATTTSVPKATWS